MNLRAYLDRHCKHGIELKRSCSQCQNGRRARISMKDFAARVGVSPSMVCQWLSGHRPIAAERVLKIEQATNKVVSRHEIRPDIYPREDAA